MTEALGPPPAKEIGDAIARHLKQPSREVVDRHQPPIGLDELGEHLLQDVVDVLRVPYPPADETAQAQLLPLHEVGEPLVWILCHPAVVLLTLDVRTREQWRQWLARHHASSPGIWLVRHKQHTGIKSMAYEDLVREALCIGWVDNLIKRLDDEHPRVVMETLGHSPMSLTLEAYSHVLASLQAEVNTLRQQKRGRRESRVVEPLVGQ